MKKMLLCNRCKAQIKNAMLSGDCGGKWNNVMLPIFKHEIIAAQEAGWGHRYIAKEYGVSAASMYRYLREGVIE